MNTELDERIRAAFGAIFDATPELGPAPSKLVLTDVSDRSRHRSWVSIAAAAVVMIGIGGLLVITRSGGGSEPTASTDSVQTNRPIGQFVWPAPPRDLATLDDLNDAFTDEVLSWPSADVGHYGDYTMEPGPQTFTLVNNKLNVEVALVAIPSPDGWGFVQAGSSLSASVTDQTISVQFPTPPGTAASSIEARFSDGTLVTDTATGPSFELPEGRQLDTLTSVLVVHANDNDDVIGVSGGQFMVDGDAEPPNSAPG